MAVKLRDHQIEAVDAIVRGLDIPPGGIPADGLRGQVHSACGTGKTIMAAVAAKRLIPHGRVLVLVPTLDLLKQTVKSWRNTGHVGDAVAVCSLEEDPQLWGLDVRATTNPVRLALWHGSGPVTMFGTYASLGVLAEAFEGEYGQRLAPMDLVVVDEAHRTSGSLGKAWAAVHDQGVIPAARRLYMTATPRIWQERPPTWEVAEGVRDALPAELAASMDDAEIFGPVLYKLTLASAVARGLLARYQIIVVELTDPVVTPERLRGPLSREEGVRGERMGALQGALLRTMADHGLQTTITFHHRRIEAQAFAEGLGGVAARLHADQSGKYPSALWADWLCGEHTPERREDVLGGFGGTAQRAVLSNCRVLGEGVDIRAVDSVALIDPKGAPHDIVQAIGRALRQKPGQGKLASLIVPVFLKEGEQPEDMFTSGSYRPLVKVLEGLRAHDEEAVELLAIPQEGLQRTKPMETIGAAPEEGEEESRLLLRFAAPRDPVMVANWVSFNVISVERQDWARGWAALKRYAERTGGARVPYDHREGSYPLGTWVAEQRRAFGAGQLSAVRAQRLESLGMVWDVADAQFQENLAAARVYFEMHWTLCAPRGAMALDRPVGQWLSNLRRAGALEGHPERVAALAEIDPDWNPEWPADWQRHYAAVRELLREEDQAVVLPGVTVHGMDVGRWLARHQEHAVWQGLVPGQRERLTALGIQPPAPELEAPAKASGGRLGAFERGVAAFTQYRERTGSVGPVSRSHEEVIVIDGEEVTVKLGVFLSNTKTRRAKLSADRLVQLAALGLEWAAA
ncbi:DEAD/DEAH box helicase [Streptomyces hyaluromycini]|uniref:DEAD/DEAH box helicase n=1 Tax=Streptomyces hyaluromycini TaxID=1377993 RepID=UPI000B5C7A23|nr:DEAD/DEAH box helicase [Streptomyces hyaluromycini]